MDNNTYTILLENKTQDVQKAGALPKTSSLGTGGSSGGETSDSGKITAGKIIAKTVYGERKIRSAIDMAITPALSRVELRTGSREQHQRANFAYSIASKGFNFVESMAMGYAVGNIAGAAIGAALSLASTVVSIGQKQITIDTQKSLEDVTRNLSAQRVTVSGGRYMNATEF